MPHWRLTRVPDGLGFFPMGTSWLQEPKGDSRGQEAPGQHRHPVAVRDMWPGARVEAGFQRRSASTDTPTVTSDIGSSAARISTIWMTRPS
ncbi:unnamed protein product [Gulo gulo]|uniref:Uncharacterized protein n=1 Tax=Gulo gulo TaxID=48420 RepID=A0A9X9LHN3_GULGU|nr:unnamed protein product [Gulo gulo]